jgi:AcrR family transcriptional regulator
MAAMLECVGEEGYAATTVPRVVARARVSRNAFYALFHDKLECFLAVCDELAEEVLDELRPSEPTDWLSGLRTGTQRYLRWWQERPAWSRTYLLEAPAAGPAAREQRQRQYARFQEMFDALAAWGRREQPALPPLWPRASQVIVHSITDLVADEVGAGRIGGLVDLEDDLVFLILTLLADEQTARREAGTRI